jgi:hypothetical protein
MTKSNKILVKSKICERCKSVKINKNKPNTTGIIDKNEEFKNAYPYFTSSEDIDKEIKIKKERKNLNLTEIIKTNLRPNEYIFYFATHYKKLDDIRINFRDNAYGLKNGKIINSGITKSNKNGDAIFHLECPQVYSTPSGRVYPRHFHYIYWNHKNNKWDTKIYTEKIFCKIDFLQLNNIIKNKSHIIIDALSFESYKKQHIPSSISLFDMGIDIDRRSALLDRRSALLDRRSASLDRRSASLDRRSASLDNLTRNQVKNNIKKVIKEYQKIYNEVYINKNMKLNEVPIIIYCWNKDCNAAINLKNKLDNLGFVNTFYYKEGLEEYLRKLEIEKSS